jgi:hypothetical protein
MTDVNSRVDCSTAIPHDGGGHADQEIRVQVSPMIEREFNRRVAFPELRFDHAERIVNGATAVHRVGLARAREIAADAEIQRCNGSLTRGIRAAYSALARNTLRAIREEERRGLWQDPGLNVAVQRADDSPARFNVDDVVLSFANDDVEYGVESVIVRAYGMQRLMSDDGRYVDEDGRRFDYRRGYLIVCKGSGDTRFFAAPHQLTRDDCQPSYLSLVHSASSQSSAEVCQ